MKREVDNCGFYTFWISSLDSFSFRPCWSPVPSQGTRKHPKIMFLQKVRLRSRKESLRS